MMCNILHKICPPNLAPVQLKYTNYRHPQSTPRVLLNSFNPDLVLPSN